MERCITVGLSRNRRRLPTSNAVRDDTLTETPRQRWIEHMAVTADVVGLPGYPGPLDICRLPLEWGTRIVVFNSQPGADVIEHAPVPLWNWGQTPPFQPQQWDAPMRQRKGAIITPINTSPATRRESVAVEETGKPKISECRQDPRFKRQWWRRADEHFAHEGTRWQWRSPLHRSRCRRCLLTFVIAVATSASTAAGGLGR